MGGSKDAVLMLNSQEGAGGCVWPLGRPAYRALKPPCPGKPREWLAFPPFTGHHVHFRSRCVEAVHPLERQFECSAMARKDEAGMARCVEDFCGRCCKDNTVLLGATQKYKCLKRCRANEIQAAALHAHFSKMRSDCTDLQGEGFSHCDKVTYNHSISLLSSYM